MSKNSTEVTWTNLRLLIFDPMIIFRFLFPPHILVLIHHFFLKKKALTHLLAIVWGPG